LEAAWERDFGERAAFLDEACADDPGLRSRVQALLAADDNIGEFMATPAVGLSKVQTASVSGEPRAGRSDEDSPLTGTRVGRFSINGLIGKGGIGVVYRAVREDDFRMHVAIKLLKRGTDTEAALSRFRAERQILARLQHPNIARLLDRHHLELCIARRYGGALLYFELKPNVAPPTGNAATPFGGGSIVIHQ
jgi:hypothetical protein